MIHGRREACTYTHAHIYIHEVTLCWGKKKKMVVALLLVKASAPLSPSLSLSPVMGMAVALGIAVHFFVDRDPFSFTVSAPAHLDNTRTRPRTHPTRALGASRGKTPETKVRKASRGRSAPKVDRAVETGRRRRRSSSKADGNREIKRRIEPLQEPPNTRTHREREGKRGKKGA